MQRETCWHIWRNLGCKGLFMRVGCVCVWGISPTSGANVPPSLGATSVEDCITRLRIFGTTLYFIFYLIRDRISCIAWAGVQFGSSWVQGLMQACTTMPGEFPDFLWKVSWEEEFLTKWEQSVWSCFISQYNFLFFVSTSESISTKDTGNEACFPWVWRKLDFMQWHKWVKGGMTDSAWTSSLTLPSSDEFQTMMSGWAAEESSEHSAASGTTLSLRLHDNLHNEVLTHYSMGKEILQLKWFKLQRDRHGR